KGNYHFTHKKSWMEICYSVQLLLYETSGFPIRLSLLSRVVSVVSIKIKATNRQNKFDSQVLLAIFVNQAFPLSKAVDQRLKFKYQLSLSFWIPILGFRE